MCVSLNISYNKREKQRNASLIIKMKDSTPEITDPQNPNEPPRKFTFDYSYWSHDGFEANAEGYLAATAPNYADQVWYFITNHCCAIIKQLRNQIKKLRHFDI